MRRRSKKLSSQMAAKILKNERAEEFFRIEFFKKALYITNFVKVMINW